MLSQAFDAFLQGFTQSNIMIKCQVFPPLSLIHSESNSAFRWFMCLACQSVDLWPVYPSLVDLLFFLLFTHKCAHRNTQRQRDPDKNNDVAMEKWGTVLELSHWNSWRGHTTAARHNPSHHSARHNVKYISRYQPKPIMRSETFWQKRKQKTRDSERSTNPDLPSLTLE